MRSTHLGAVTLLGVCALLPATLSAQGTAQSAAGGPTGATSGAQLACQQNSGFAAMYAYLCQKRSTSSAQQSATTLPPAPRASDAERALTVVNAGMELISMFGSKSSSTPQLSAAERAERRASEDSAIAAHADRRRELWLRQRAAAQAESASAAGSVGFPSANEQPSAPGRRRTMPDGARPAFPNSPSGTWTPWYSLTNSAGEEFPALDVAYYAGQGMASDLGDGLMTWALRNRFNSPVTLKVRVTKTCGRVCNGLVFEQTVTLQPGERWTAPVAQGRQFDVVGLSAQ